MANILSEQDTFFGSIAFRNKLITQKQLQKGVIEVQKNPGKRLGDVMVDLGYMTQEQVNAILSMQNVQRKKLKDDTSPLAQTPPPRPAAPSPLVEEELPVSAPPAPDKEARTSLDNSLEEIEFISASDSLFSLPGGEDIQAPTIKFSKPPVDLELKIESISSFGMEDEEDAKEEVRFQATPEEPAQARPAAALDLGSKDLEAGASDLDSLIAELESPSAPATPKPSKPLVAAQSKADDEEEDFQPFSPSMAIGGQAPQAVQSTPVAPPKPVPVPSTPASPAKEPPVEFIQGDPNRLVCLEDYLRHARDSGASDLHISAEVKPFLRLHGRVVPLDAPVLSAVDTERLLFSVLSTNQKSALMHHRGLELCLEPPDGRHRCVFFKQRCGWDANFHVIRNQVPTFAELGLPESLKRLTEYNQGLVLVTGPSNSGKTTTLAALIDEVNRTRDDHIITVEKPVEYIHIPQRCQVTQREVGSHTNSFSIALRAALREDPDIIMVGELRDLETLSIAITASETGHLVFGTLPTISAANTVSRIVDGFPVGQQAQIRMMLSESLRGIISQQLIPRKDGAGVALALEILFITSAISALIRDNQPHQIPSVIQTSRKMGMCRLDDSLMDLFQKKIISGREAWRRADSKAPFENFKNED
jgi:twitching motility protein PilT